MKRYPAIEDEFSTMRGLLKSRNSLARYGDGEFKIACGGSCVSQGRNAKLTERLREILRTPQDGLTVAIPRIVGRYDLKYCAPKAYEFWTKVSEEPSFVALLGDEMRYGSSFVTRMDNAPHIHCAEYWKNVQALFAAADVVVVSGQFKQSNEEILKRAVGIKHVEVPGRDAFGEYDAILKKCISFGKEKTFYLSCGPTATVLAADLCAAGYRALDMGAMHRFWMGGRLCKP